MNRMEVVGRNSGYVLPEIRLIDDTQARVFDNIMGPTILVVAWLILQYVRIQVTEMIAFPVLVGGIHRTRT